MAEMVWCNSCKTVIWAYDRMPNIDLRGICNMFNLPCPKCGEKKNFDGWGSNNAYAQVVNGLRRGEEDKIYDNWSAMKYIAELNKVKWEPSPDNSWFNRP